MAAVYNLNGVGGLAGWRWYEIGPALGRVGIDIIPGSSSWTV